ncbi:hypothetical protein RHSIM_Rhsim05G0145100 [Rhododendron simsii]|uniref:FAF domain-containing protein n=1 Tax=Rhododendron simsii TaxID=118357 RepID=A0A834LR21_RHOSS|nr:hypothetical protein RHSIM_Rhsim05G0145100 [Rhododendron simsii]
MLNFCIKSVHSFLAFTTKENNNNNGTLILDQQLQSSLHGRRIIPSPVSGLGFITFSDNTHNPTNVVDSAAIKPPPPPTVTTVAKKDPGGIGFLDEVGGSVNGLMSCTESLGFESSDERRVDDQVMERITSEERGSGAGARKKWKRTRGRRDEVEARKFPPPLSSMNRDGRPSFILRPVRRDGRLELTEVKIDRTEILHASRQDGRLRLDMIRDVADVEEDHEEEEKVDIDNNNNIIIIEEEEKVEEEKIGDIAKEEEEVGVREKWVFPAVLNSGGDALKEVMRLMMELKPIKIKSGRLCVHCLEFKLEEAEIGAGARPKCIVKKRNMLLSRTYLWMRLCVHCLEFELEEAEIGAGARPKCIVRKRNMLLSRTYLWMRLFEADVDVGSGWGSAEAQQHDDAPVDAWIKEHFPTLHPVVDPEYTEELPQA